MAKKTKSVRVQMSIETEKELKLLAEKYDCFYNNEPSLSMLFAKIGRRELAIQPSELTTKSTSFNNYTDSNLDLLVLTMNCPFDANGIVAKVTEKIINNKGNIFKIDAKHEKKNLGVLKIHLSLGKYEDSYKKIVQLLVDIYNISLGSIEKFNTPEKMQNTYKFLLDHTSNSLSAEKTKDIYIEAAKQKIILNISCKLGIEIIAKNAAESLNYITEIIASNKALISHIIQNFDNAKREDIVKVFLEIKIPEKQLSKEEQHQEITNEISKIKKIMNGLQSGIDGNRITKVRPLNIYDIDALKNSGFEIQDI